jgi:T4 RnlA family RNA ligase
MALRIQEFLRAHAQGGLDLLREQYGVKARRHAEFPHIISLKYDQIGSPTADPIVVECRGIILDESNDWAVVARPFDRFFNYGDGHAAEIDWSTARVQTKEDGSLAIFYYYADQWRVATSGTPDASGDVNGFGFTFAKLFYDAAHRHEMWPTAEAEEYTFLFELTGPFNRIVVQHHESSVTLLAARHTQTGQEIHPVDAARMLHPIDPVRIVQEYPLTSAAEIVASFDSISPLSQEGYVVVDGAFNRIKVKHPGYVALHHAKDGLGPKVFVEIARSGETSEVIAAFPEFAPMIEEAKSRFADLVSAVEADYQLHKAIAVQKDFALAVRGSRCTAALFQVRSGKVASVREFFRNARIEMLMDLLGYRNIEAAKEAA